jgi:hypothetical protein
MNSMLATEPAVPASQEVWAENERMRHIPTVDWMVWKVDSDLRRTINKVLDPILTLKTEDPRRARFESELRNLCRALDRLAEVAKHSRHNGQGGDVVHRIEAAMSYAVANLRSLDSSVIGRRFPFHTFERSKAEPLYGALLLTMSVVERLVVLTRDLDPSLDERLLEGTVVLQNPVDDRMLRPIA